MKIFQIHFRFFSSEIFLFNGQLNNKLKVFFFQIIPSSDAMLLRRRNYVKYILLCMGKKNPTWTTWRQPFRQVVLILGRKLFKKIWSVRQDQQYKLSFEFLWRFWFFFFSKRENSKCRRLWAPVKNKFAWSLLGQAMYKGGNPIVKCGSKSLLALQTCIQLYIQHLDNFS